MTPHPGKQTVTLPILLNLSQSKGNQTLKFGQVMEYNQKFFFFWKIMQKMRLRLVPDL